jgi:hypothetical protein
MALLNSSSISFSYPLFVLIFSGLFPSTLPVLFQLLQFLLSLLPNVAIVSILISQFQVVVLFFFLVNTLPHYRVLLKCVDKF